MQKTGNQWSCKGYAAWWVGAFQGRVLATHGDGQFAEAVRFVGDGCLGRLVRSSYLSVAGIELNACYHHVTRLTGNNPADGAAEFKLLRFKFYRLADGDQSVRQQQTKARATDV